LSRVQASIEIVPFAAAHLPAMIKLSERAWVRPRSEEFYRWRYLQSPAQRMLVALRGEECLATIGAFLRDYRLNGERRTCLETLDWFCLPQYRISGLGVRVLQALMKGPEPIVAVGGTPHTLAVLPRLGWSKITTLSFHLLPLDASVIDEPLNRRFRIPPKLGRAAFGLFGRAWFSARLRSRPMGGTVRPMASVEEEISPLYEGDTGYRVLPLPNFAHLRWLTEGYPEAGPFVILHFMVGGKLRGWTLLRVHGPEHRWVSLVEAYAPRPDEELYTWMVSESLIRAAEFRPLGVDTQTSCPILRAALHRNRFLELGPSPVHSWPAGLSGASGPVHMVRNASDGALLPYPGSSPNGLAFSHQDCDGEGSTERRPQRRSR